MPLFLTATLAFVRKNPTLVLAALGVVAFFLWSGHQQRVGKEKIRKEYEIRAIEGQKEINNVQKRLNSSRSDTPSRLRSGEF